MLLRLVQDLDRDPAPERLGRGRDDDPGVQERGQQDRGDLERPVADDEADGSAHRRSCPSRPAVPGRASAAPRAARRAAPGREGRATAAWVRSRDPGCESRSRRAVPRPSGRSSERQRPRQLRLVEVAPDPGPLDEADLAGLLGDDDHDRVGLLGDPERGPVAGPVALRLDRRLGQRQEGAGGEDRLATDDDRAVVERRPRREQRLEQLGGQVAVDHHAGLGDLLEAGLPLETMSAPAAGGGQSRRRPGDRAGDAVGRPLVGGRRAARRASRPGRAGRGRAAARAGTRRRGRRGRRRRRPGGAG